MTRVDEHQPRAATQAVVTDVTARAAQGEQLTAISDGMVALLKEFYGRGPT